MLTPTERSKMLRILKRSPRADYADLDRLYRFVTQRNPEQMKEKKASERSPSSIQDGEPRCH
jgi:ribosomal protein S18